MLNLFKSPPTLISTNDRIQFLVLIGVRLSLIIAIVWSVISQDWENLGMATLAYGSTYVPNLLERRYRVLLPIEFHVIIVLFLYGSLFLGEFGDAYQRFWWWDVMLHISSGVVLGFVGFLILYVLRLQKRLQMSPGLVAFFAFCVAMAGGAVWEIFEFGVDQLFGATMQKSLGDTMQDLIVDGLGALAIVLAARSYLLQPHRSFISRFIDNFVQLNPRFSGKK